MVVFALAIPFVGVAAAGHNTAHDLDCQPERDTNPTTNDPGTPGADNQHTVYCLVSATAGETTEVDFEVEGPNDPRNDGFSPETPDGTDACQAGEPDPAGDPFNPGADQCVVAFTYTGTNVGQDEITAFIDDNQNNADNNDPNAGELDFTEGPNAGATDAAQGATGTTEGGTKTDPDDTDVVVKQWFAAQQAETFLDCDDDDNDDTETNPAGQPEVYTCTVFVDANDSGTRDAGETAAAGVRIDAENLGGANDPDNAALNPVDYDNACVTNADGTCQFTLVPTENEVGTADVCFFIDADNDNEFVLLGGQQDGGECDSEGTEDPNTAGTDEPGAGTDANDQTDTVRKTWAQAGQPANIDCSPENASNQKGTQHAVTCTVYDQFGNPVQGATVDINIEGENDGTDPNLNNAVTNAQGQVTLTYTDTTTGDETANPEIDTITGCVDQAPGGAGVCSQTAEAVNEQERNDLTDTVQKFWFTTVPQPATVVVDMEFDDAVPAPGVGTTGCGQDDPTAEDNPVNTTHDLCAIVRDANGAPVPGAEVTFTAAGPGQFIFDADNDDNFDDGEGRGATFTTTTDENGQAFAELHSTQTGITTVTATAGGRSDTGTKRWVAVNETRQVNCEPETATNAPGTSHVITCTALDRFGNPVPGRHLVITESGPGRIESIRPGAATGAPAGTSCTTDQNGECEVVVTSTQAESGNQTIRAEAQEDVADQDNAGDNDDPCDQPANTPQGAPAGACEDDVLKTWAVDTGPEPECSDEIDNDNDGEIDFPADEGCESAVDDSESDFPDQEFGGETGQMVTEGACAGFTTGSVQANSTGSGLVIVGTNGDDALQGSNGDDLICALDGEDTINGDPGDDTIWGGGGKDSIEAGDGNDTVMGEGGRDLVNGGDGADEIFGGRSHDNLSGGAGADVLRGQAGWDTLKGNGGNDRLIGAGGRDVLQGGGGNDTALGGGDDDVIRGYRGNDILRGGGGDDIIKGFAGRDRLFGNAGADILNGGPGRDRCRGGGGNDTLQRCNP